MEKIFASCKSDGINNQNNRELKKLNSPKINDSIKNWTNELNRAFSKEEVHMKK
jgi:hypothetical protein